MKTIYLHAPAIADICADLLAAGVLREVQSMAEPTLMPVSGCILIKVGKIEDSPTEFDEQMQLVAPATFQEGEFANLIFESDVKADDFTLLFAPTHGTTILPTPDHPVSVLLSGGAAAGQAAAAQAVFTVPATWVSRRAFFLALYEVTQITPDNIKTTLAGNTVALIELEAPHFDPANPLFASLAAEFNVTQEQLDLIWALARRL